MTDSGLLCIFGVLAIAFLLWFVLRLIKPKHHEIQSTPQNKVPNSSQGNARPAMPSTDNRFREVMPGTQSNSPRATLTYSMETGSSRFIKDAQKNHDIEGKPAEPVPFMQYWPTFEVFNAQQKKWYFYWRSEVRQGRYPRTDLSYIFVYIYELLCLVEKPDPAQAAEQIKTIWRAYRPLYPELDRYLPEWGGDLITTKVGAAQGVAWWWEFMTKYGVHPPAAIINVIIQRAVEAGKANELPYAVWAGLNLYQPQNKFYQRFNQDGMIDQGYLKAILAVDAYYLSLKAKKGLLERYAPPKLYPQMKTAFQSAIVPGDYPKKISIGEARNYASSSRLGNLLVSITKYAENILRKQNRFSARLSGFELEEKLRLVLDEAFAQQPVAKKAEEPIRIKLDSSRIEALKEESELVSGLLEPETGEEHRPLYSDIAQVRALWEKLDLPARRLLLILYQHQIEEVSQITSEMIGAPIAPFVLIDRINNFSLPLLGDRIISVENRKDIMIADDFVDEMELISKDHPLQSLANELAGQPSAETVDPWQRFIQQLSVDEDNLLLKLVTAGSLGEEEIEAFARTRHQMGNLLIEGINEKAIEQLGRTPFYPEDNCWYIEEEDLNVLREIVKVEGA